MKYGSSPEYSSPVAGTGECEANGRTAHSLDISFNILLERENQNQAAYEVRLAKVEDLPIIIPPHVSSYLICII